MLLQKICQKIFSGQCSVAVFKKVGSANCD